MNDLVAQAADATLTPFIMPGWTVLTAWAASTLVSVSVVWRWVSGMVDERVDNRVDHALDERLVKYEELQLQLVQDVAYIRGRMNGDTFKS